MRQKNYIFFLITMLAPLYLRATEPLTDDSTYTSYEQPDYSLVYISTQARKSIVELQDLLPNYNWSLLCQMIYKDIKDENSVIPYAQIDQIIDECLEAYAMLPKNQFQFIQKELSDYQQALHAGMIHVETLSQTKGCSPKKFSKLCVRCLTVTGAIAVNGSFFLNGVDVTNTVGIPGPTGATGATGPVGPTGATGPAGTIVGSMFYGLTAGTGNGGPTDYAATIAAKTAAGTGRVPFPRNGPLGAGIVRVDASSFTLPNIGTYLITFKVHTTEPGQLELELNGAELPETVAVNMNPTSGGHPIIGNALVTTSSTSSVLAVINPPGNTPALTITPADGADTHANAQSITILQIA
jgi:hypothetical protein